MIDSITTRTSRKSPRVSLATMSSKRGAWILVPAILQTQHDKAVLHAFQKHIFFLPVRLNNAVRLNKINGSRLKYHE